MKTDYMFEVWRKQNPKYSSKLCELIWLTTLEDEVSVVDYSDGSCKVIITWIDK